MQLETILLWVAVLMFVSVVSSKISDRFSVPVLLVFWQSASSPVPKG
jgi:cell volume regulation protein A